MSLEEKRNNLIKLENKRQKLVKLRNEIFYYITDLSLGGYSEEIEEIDKYFTKYFKCPSFEIKKYKEDQFYEYLTFEIIEVNVNSENLLEDLIEELNKKTRNIYEFVYNKRKDEYKLKGQPKILIEKPYSINIPREILDKIFIYAREKNLWDEVEKNLVKKIKKIDNIFIQENI